MFFLNAKAHISMGSRSGCGNAFHELFLVHRMHNRKKDISYLRSKLDALDRKFTSSARSDGDGPPKQRERPPALEELNRAVRKKRNQKEMGQAQNVSKKSRNHSPIVYHRTIRRKHTQTPDTPVFPAWSVNLEDAVDGAEVAIDGEATAYYISTVIDEIEQAEAVSRSFSMRLTEKGSCLKKKMTALVDNDKISPDDFVFMDIETTGLSNSPLFLIGIMIWNDTGFEVKQFFARNYSEEAAVIRMFIDECRLRKILVTFNGKSFDFPYIRTRAAATGVRFDLEPFHFDLLHESRRIWKHELPDCKLQTLERHVCNRMRQGDIPGSEIPDAYHSYVHSKNAWQIVEILKHNLLDLITLADLMARMGES
ncbi:MAG: hypothetical protein GF350_11350 [Chitinivibrionales bacterium]|nr:hypothetical protein [Chitinivibrionales bacterium]